jgi:hypothetical protein
MFTQSANQEKSGSLSRSLDVTGVYGMTANHLASSVDDGQLGSFARRQALLSLTPATAGQ